MPQPHHASSPDHLPLLLPYGPGISYDILTTMQLLTSPQSPQWVISHNKKKVRKGTSRNLLASQYVLYFVPVVECMRLIKTDQLTGSMFFNAESQSQSATQSRQQQQPGHLLLTSRKGLPNCGNNKVYSVCKFVRIYANCWAVVGGTKEDLWKNCTT